MDRISISVAPPQMSWLKRTEAKRLGVTIGELLRVDHRPIQVRDAK